MEALCIVSRSYNLSVEINGQQEEDCDQRANCLQVVTNEEDLGVAMMWVAEL